jgi:hypothetical protein
MHLPFQKAKFHSSAIMPLFVLVTLGLHLLLILMMVYSGLQTTRLANRPLPVAVQMEGGRIIGQTPMPPEFRTPEVIQTVVKDWVIATLNWRLKTEQGATDPGVAIANGRKVPSVVWKASFLLSEQDNFRSKFLQLLAQLIPYSIFTGQATTAVELNSLSAPQSISPGRWKVDLVSNVLIFDTPGAAGRSLFTFNKRIFLRAVPSLTNPLPEQATDVQKLIYNLRLAGLEIDEIQDL